MGLLFLIVIFVCVSQIEGGSRSVTNEDIRDAILSIVNMIRSTEDKLERHEFRERTLGDQFKKVLSTIDKRQRLLDPVKGTISRLDQRLATVETILLQKDERERIQMQKVFDMVEQIHRSLPQLFETLKNDITSSFSSAEEKPQDSPNNFEIEKLQKEIATKIDDTSSTVKHIEGQLSQIREENKNNFTSTHKFMEQYDNKLKEYNKHIDVLPTRCKELNDAQTNVIVKALETQDNHIKTLRQEINGANATIKQLHEKIANMHGHIENGQKDVRELISESKKNYKNYDIKLSAIPGMHKNETEEQTKKLLKALETHDASLKHLQNELVKLNTKTLPDQNAKIVKKLELLPKIISNDDLLLNRSKHVQDALSKQSGVVNTIENQIKSLAEEIPKQGDAIVKAFNRELPKTQENVERMLSQIKYESEKIATNQKELNREFEKIVNQSIVDDFKKYASQSEMQRKLISEALAAQKADILAIPESCTNQVGLLKKDLQMHTQILQRDNLVASQNINRTHSRLDALTKSVDENKRAVQDLKQQSAEDLKVFRNRIFVALDNHNVTTREYQKRFDNAFENFRKDIQIRSDAIESLVKNASDNVRKELIQRDQTQKMAENQQSLLDNLEVILKAMQTHNEEVKKSLTESKSVLQRHENELIDYNDKMDALPWKHKVENDKQTEMIVRRLEQVQHFVDEKLKISTENNGVLTAEVETLRKILENVVRESATIKDLNGTVASMMKLIEMQPKQDKEKAAALVQTIEKQMLFIATTAASNINDRLDRITTSQFDQFTSKMDAIALGRKVESAQHYNAIVQECTNQNARMEDVLRKLNALSTELPKNETFKALQSGVDKLPDAFQKTINEAIAVPNDVIRTKMKEINKQLGEIGDQMKYVNEGIEYLRLDRITSSQFDQFTSKMDAIALSRKVESAQHYNAIVQECTNQNVRMEDVLRKLNVLSTELPKNETFKDLQRGIDKLPEALKKTINEAMAVPNDMIQTKVRDFKEQLGEIGAQIKYVTEAMKAHSIETNVSNHIDQAISKMQKHQMEIGNSTIEIQQQIIEMIKNTFSSRLKTLEELQKSAASTTHIALKNISSTLEKRLDDNIGQVKELPLKLNIEFAQQASLIFQALKHQDTKNEQLYEKVQNINDQFNDILTKLAMVANQQMQLVLQAMETESRKISSIAQTVTQFKKYIETFKDELRNDSRLKEMENRQVIDILLTIPSDINKINEELSSYNRIASDCGAVVHKALEAQVEQVNKLEKHFTNNTSSTHETLQVMQTNLAKIHEHNQKHGEVSEAINKNISENNELLQKFSAKLEDYRSECREHEDVQSSLQLQQYVNHLNDEHAKMRNNTKENYENVIRLLNKTTDKLQECTKLTTLEEIKNTSERIISSLGDLQNKSDNSKLLDSIKMLEELTDNLNANIALSFGKLFEEIDNLQKMEEIVRQTGDGVIDTKRRVEYGVRQISTEISNLVKGQTKELSTAFGTRFDNLETSLLDNDEGILANLTTRMTQEVDQVWKQIGIMHRQVTITNELINDLLNKTDVYGNGTANTIDAVKGKVAIITSRTIEMGNNLKTLFGQMSLITQEFNHIKKELGNTLNEMKRNLQTAPNRTPQLTDPGRYSLNRMS